MTKDLTIIIVTYNSSQIIKNCLSNINFDKYDVVIVDNASLDNTINLVKSSFSKVKIIKSNKNIGFSRANNLALRQVVTKYSLILNPDAIIKESDIEHILFKMKQYQNVATAGPLVLEQYPINSKEIATKQKGAEKDFATIKDNFRQKIDDECYFVRFIIGAAIFFNMDLMRKIGFFDENIFMYYDDDEICNRVNKNGYFNMISTNSFALHIGGASSSGQEKFRSIYKKNWHLNGWSKHYWKQIKKGKLRAKRSSFKFCFKYAFLTLFSLFAFNKKKLAGNLGSMSGSFCFFVGLKSFKKNGAARG